MADMRWPGCSRCLKGVILDLCGVLYDCGESGGVAIPGSIEALRKWVNHQWFVPDIMLLATSMFNYLSKYMHWLSPSLTGLLTYKCLFFRLKASDLKLRFCTNESQQARTTFVAKLQRLGFDITVPEVFSPAPAAVAVLENRGLRPHLLVCDGNALFREGFCIQTNKVHIERLAWTLPDATS